MNQPVVVGEYSPTDDLSSGDAFPLASDETYHIQLIIF